MFPRSGRPRAIDTEGVENLTNFVRSESPSKDLFKQVLMDEHVSTMCRRRPGIDVNEVLPLSVRSVGRYVSALYLDGNGDDDSTVDYFTI